MPGSGSISGLETYLLGAGLTAGIIAEPCRHYVGPPTIRGPSQSEESDTTRKRVA